MVDIFISTGYWHVVFPTVFIVFNRFYKGLLLLIYEWITFFKSVFQNDFKAVLIFRRGFSMKAWKKAHVDI